MAEREYRHALDDMLEAIDGVLGAAAAKTYDDYESEWLLRAGVERGIEIISEASRRLPDAVKARRPDVPWPQMRAIGNVLRHEYHGVSRLILWRVVTDELPRLREAVVFLPSDDGLQ